MAQLKIATARITLPYTVAGRHHKARAFVKDLASEGGGEYTVLRRDGTGRANWEDCAEGFGYAIGLLLPTGVTYSDLILEELSGIVWVPRAFHTHPLTPGSGTLVPYSQMTVTFRDTAFKKIKVVALDSSQSLFQQTVNPLAGDSNMDAFLAEYSAAFTKTEGPYDWQCSIEELFLNTAPFVSFSSWPNRKLAENQGV